MIAGSFLFYHPLENSKNYSIAGLLLERIFCRQLSTSYGVIWIPKFYHLENYKRKTWDIVDKTGRNTKRKTTTSFSHTGR